MTLFDRIFELHRILSARRRPVAATVLQAEMGGCSPATLKRVIAKMRDQLNAPIEFDREHGGYYYARDAAMPMFELPGLWLAADELAALLTLEQVLERQPMSFLAEALAPVRDRAIQLLEREGVGLPAWRTRLRLLRAQARSPGAAFQTVAGALSRSRRLHFTYLSRGADTERERTVSPQRLTLYRDNWYLDAWCHEAKALRTFSVDRIRKARVLEKPSRDIAEADLEQFLARSYGIFSGEAQAMAELRFTPWAARWVADESWHPDQMDERLPDGGLLRRVPYSRAEELVMDLLRHGPEVEVLAPADLRAAVTARLAHASRQYQKLTK